MHLDIKTISPILLRALCRFTLVMVLVAAAKLAFAPGGINLAHYTPNQFFRNMGLPYEFILAYEVHFHLFLHFIVGCVITLLIYGAKFLGSLTLLKQIMFSALVTIGFSLAAEVVQSTIGRNVELVDLLMAGLGILTAVFILLKIAVLR